MLFFYAPSKVWQQWWNRNPGESPVVLAGIHTTSLAVALTHKICGSNKQSALTSNQIACKSTGRQSKHSYGMRNRTFKSAMRVLERIVTTYI